MALHAGYGVRGILEMLDQAARRVYRPQSFEEEDFQRAYLIWKLGGAAAARIAQRSLGLPSIDSARRHIATTPIRASADFPTPEKLRYNLSSTFKDTALGSGGARIGAVIAVDEIKIQERLRWEMRLTGSMGCVANTLAIS